MFFTALIKEKLDEQREQILAEYSSERAAHQKMVKEYARLDQRYANLEEELRLEKSDPSRIAMEKNKQIDAGNMRYSICFYFLSMKLYNQRNL